MNQRRTVKIKPDERIKMGYQPRKNWDGEFEQLRDKERKKKLALAFAGIDENTKPTVNVKKPLIAEKKEGYYLNEGGRVVEYSRRMPTARAWIILINLLAIGLNLLTMGAFAPALIIINSAAILALLIAPTSPKTNGKLVSNKETVLFHHLAINDPVSIREPIFQEAIADYIKDPSDGIWWTNQFKALNKTAVEIREARKKESSVVRKDYAENLRIQKQLESGLTDEGW